MHPRAHDILLDAKILNKLIISTLKSDFFVSIFENNHHPGFCVSAPPDFRISLCAMGNRYILSSQ